MEENQEAFVSWKLKEETRIEGNSNKQGGMLPWDALCFVLPGMSVSLQIWSRIVFSSPTNLALDYIIWFVCSSVAG